MDVTHTLTGAYQDHFNPGVCGGRLPLEASQHRQHIQDACHSCGNGISRQTEHPSRFSVVVARGERRRFPARGNCYKKAFIAISKQKSSCYKTISDLIKIPRKSQVSELLWYNSTLNLTLINRFWKFAFSFRWNLKDYKVGTKNIDQKKLCAAH